MNMCVQEWDNIKMKTNKDMKMDMDIWVHENVNEKRLFPCVNISLGLSSCVSQCLCLFSCLSAPLCLWAFVVLSQYVSLALCLCLRPRLRLCKCTCTFVSVAVCVYVYVYVSVYVYAHQTKKKRSHRDSNKIVKVWSAHVCRGDAESKCRACPHRGKCAWSVSSGLGWVPRGCPNQETSVTRTCPIKWPRWRFWCPGLCGWPAHCRARRRPWTTYRREPIARFPHNTNTSEKWFPRGRRNSCSRPNTTPQENVVQPQLWPPWTAIPHCCWAQAWPRSTVRRPTCSQSCSTRAPQPTIVHPCLVSESQDIAVITSGNVLWAGVGSDQFDGLNGKKDCRVGPGGELEGPQLICKTRRPHRCTKL